MSDATTWSDHDVDVMARSYLRDDSALSPPPEVVDVVLRLGPFPPPAWFSDLARRVRQLAKEEVGDA